ncbi:ENTP1-like protein [Mya arenaria]|uniref:ENTP1-like protein n=1 Tax=Mya arenaria TaxID=6604 RepID=A0ABY7FCF1_MYAAR|nr:ectonucleoside triphosphate diphosphohydrolase 1-like isoform X2 [Mya arenaria]WAR18661.1 ENTP1-like protein [Mya arenaria]
MHMLFLLCMSTYLAIDLTGAYAAGEEHDEFGIILDGGSSGTKLKIYKWTRTDADDSSGLPISELQLVEKLKFTPGISSKAFKLDEIPDYLGPILLTATSIVPAEKHATTPIYFMATAGLRVLPVNATEGLLEAVERNLQDKKCNPFLVAARGAARVISGEEEGVYAWMAANYLRGFFSTDSQAVEPVGVLEMGGGSTQIAFLPSHSLYAHMYPVRLGAVTYRLYAHSYLLYGQNYILQRVNDYLVAIADPAVDDVPNPCMLSGDNTTHTAFGDSVHIYGSANVTKCLEIIDIFLKSADDSWCNPKPCAIGAVYQPPVARTDFYAISAFSYAPRHLQAVDDHGLLDIPLLKENAIAYCEKPLSVVVSEGLPAAYASPYCMMGLYIPALLLDAYGLSPQRNRVFLHSYINHHEIDWTLGAMLQHIEVANEGDCEEFTSGGNCHHAAVSKCRFIALMTILVAVVLGS